MSTLHPLAAPVIAAIEAATPGDARAILAATALADITPWAPWTVNGVTITLVDGPFVTPGDTRSVEVWVSASDSNGPLPVENPYQFIGLPPVINSGTVLIPNYETLDVAFKRQIAEVVRSVAEQMGWSP